MAERPRENRFRAGVAAVLVVALVIVVYGGYGGHWSWTGINGRPATLWDWLNLLALPVAVALAPLFEELREIWGPRHSTITGVASIAFVVLVIGGYLLSWRWTGFTGNTLWNWLHLLLLPLLVPTVIVPALKPVARSRVEMLDESDERQEARGLEAARLED